VGVFGRPSSRDGALVTRKRKRKKGFLPQKSMEKYMALGRTKKICSLVWQIYREKKKRKGSYGETLGFGDRLSRGERVPDAVVNSRRVSLYQEEKEPGTNQPSFKFQKEKKKKGANPLLIKKEKGGTN